ncbi:MAG: SGNH/GDSL hydrolase family protein [Nitrospira sp.]|nr:SGNH/GDSL hydrolase family protein [Nitrospira sp.]
MLRLIKTDWPTVDEKPLAGKEFGVDGWLLGALYLSELSLLLILLTAYIVSRKPTFLSFLNSRPGYVCLAGIAGLLVSGMIMRRQCAGPAKADVRSARLTVAMNLVSVFLLFIIGEGTIRALYVETTMGDMWGKSYLLPREWSKVVGHFQGSFRSKLGKPSYMLFNETLGWTIGSGRSQNDQGVSYFSSAEGLRSASPGTAFADRHPTIRIALIGDSYTFGDEVAYEDTWGYQLEKLLGPDVQVLNFGVNAYGTGQAYLRYLQDVRAWHPDVVIFGFVDHDLVRTMSVYASLTFPTATFPYAAPRFVMRDQQLTLLNVPLPPPEQIFSAKSIDELPYIEWDRSYVNGEWDRPAWTIPTRSYLFRWLESWYPMAEDLRPDVSDAAMREVNGAIFQAFAKQAKADGAVPILVHFPSWMQDSDILDYTPLGVKILRSAGLDFLDPTDCLTPIPFADRVMPRRHYAPKGNLAVAQCFREPVAEQLAKRNK